VTLSDIPARRPGCTLWQKELKAGRSHTHIKS
jgi:hypothetical protein